MKLHSDTRLAGHHSITGCGAGYVAVNGQRYATSLILSPEQVEPDWPVRSIDDLTPELISRLACQCDVILLGTGQRQRFPAPALLRPLYEARIGIEVMDTAAACRTYNVLMAEGRNPLAALIVETPTT